MFAADEQRKQGGGDGDSDLLSINFGASNTYDMNIDRSSAADVRGLDLECLDEESDDTVKSNAIFVPEDCRTYKICNLNDLMRLADTRRSKPSQYWTATLKGILLRDARLKRMIFCRLGLSSSNNTLTDTLTRQMLDSASER